MSSSDILLFNSEDKSLKDYTRSLEEKSEDLEFIGFSDYDSALEKVDKADTIVYCLNSGEKDMERINQLKIESEVPFIVFSSGRNEKHIAELVNVDVDAYILKDRGGFRELSKTVKEELEKNDNSVTDEGLKTAEKKQRRRLDTIFNNSKDMMAILDTDQTVLKANKITENCLNMSEEELKGEKLRKHTGFLSKKECIEIFKKALEGNTASETVQVEVCGKEKILEITLSPITGERGEVKSVLFKAYDLTELKKSQNRLEAAFNSSYDMMALIDSEGNILRINNAVEEFFNVDKGEAKGKNYRELQDLIEKDSVMELYQEFFKPSNFTKLLEENYFRNTVDLEMGDGQTVTLDISLNAMTNDKGEITTILAEGRDITHSEIKERQLRDQKKRLERFSSIVSHDLRNPLNVASGYLELAEKTGEQKDFEKAMKAIDRIDHIIEELLELSGKPEHFKKQELELENIFKEACSYVEDNPDYEIVGSLKFQGGRSGAIRMFENLIKNTKEHNKDAKIKLGTIEKGFYYEDTGQIEEDIDKILEYGYSSTNYGNGLGLSIVQRVAEINEWGLNLTKNSTGGLRLEFLLKD